MFQPVSLHKTEYRRQASRTKTHQPTTNHILFRIHLPHLETEVPRVICNQVYLPQYRIEQDRPKKNTYT